MFLSYTVKSNDTYENVNQVLKAEFKISSRLFIKLLNNNKVFLNNNLIDTRSSVSANDVITVFLDFEEDSSNIIPTKMDLNILFEDDCFLIIDKSAGIAVHPSILHYEDSLSNGIKYYFDTINLHKKIRPVNRLDFNTSGIVVFAKNEFVQEMLIRQMANCDFKKEYLAIASGLFEKKNGVINEPIARKEASIIERCVSASRAIFYYRI